MQPLDHLRSIESSTFSDQLMTILRQDTANPPGKTESTIDWLQSWFEDRDVDTTRIAPDPRKPNLLATVPGETTETLLYNGHVDTVPYEATEWEFDPLGERVGERVYGRGATDMKGAIVSMLLAVDSFFETDTQPPVTLQFAFVSDEETAGDAGLPAVIDSGALDADACVIGETTSTAGRYATTVADRGSIWLTLEAAGHAAHGSRPVLGANAIDRLCEALAVLRRRLPSRTLQIHPDVEPIVEESIAYYDATMGADAASDLFYHPTVNVGTIAGGESVNTVPDSARARVDVRLTAAVETPAVLSDIRSCLAAFEGIEIVDVSWSVGTYEPIESTLVDAVTEAIETTVETRAYRRSATGGGDAKKLRNAGIPTVEFAAGTDTVHAVDEYTTIADMRTNAEVYLRLPSILPAKWTANPRRSTDRDSPTPDDTTSQRTD
ncbi:MAG: M20 family metallopeptidase [Halobacteriota archaeon]